MEEDSLLLCVWIIFKYLVHIYSRLLSCTKKFIKSLIPFLHHWIINFSFFFSFVVEQLVPYLPCFFHMQQWSHKVLVFQSQLSKPFLILVSYHWSCLIPKDYLYCWWLYNLVIFVVTIWILFICCDGGVFIFNLVK